MTTVMILYAIGYGLNIAQIVLAGTKTLPRPEKCSLGHPVKGSDSFEEYCRDRWQFKRDYAYKLIASAKVAANVYPGIQPPATEKQARPLTKLPADQQAEVWDE